MKARLLASPVVLNEDKMERLTPMKFARHLAAILIAATLCGAAFKCRAQLTQSYANTFGTAGSVLV